MFKKIILVVSVILSAQSSFCQFNDSIQHHFTFASTGTYNKTKELKSFVLSNSAGYETSKKKLGFSTFASWIYGNQNKQLSNNDVSAGANLDYLKDVKPLYYWALLNFDESYSLKINYRFQSGVGLGYTVAKEKNFNLGLSDGFVYETSDLTDARIGRDIYQTVRNSFRVKYRWDYNDRFVLEGSNFIQPSILSLKDYIIKLNNKLSVKLNKWLAIDAAMEYNKISRTNRENILLTYGLAVDKYF
ncbi:MAG: DUF481 domain-containing protein [Ginsengibacter sp.]